MDNSQPPRLLVLRNLLEPSRRAQSALEEIKEKLPNTTSESIELRGLFVLMISAVETMLTDIYVYYLHSFPEKFDFKDTKFSKDDIISANLAIDLIEQQVEKSAISQAYGSFPELLRSIMKTIDITEPPLDTDLIDRIVEAKETRNLLLHNNLKVNHRYITRAGRFRRTEDEGSNLSLTQKYVREVCENLTLLIMNLEARMIAVYASYTRLAALRRLWDYLFSSPIMEFDDFWVTDTEKDKVWALKVSPLEKQLSSSEQAFLGVWRTHFNRWEHSSRDATSIMVGLDSHHKRKMLWFLATLADFDIQ
ncbi:MAG: hypothetical protein ABR907_14960 [Terracidiphilus sp.]|jgi:hypothetical protein